MTPPFRAWLGCLPGLVLLALAAPASAGRHTPARPAAPAAREYGPPAPPSPHAMCEGAIAEAGKEAGKATKMPDNLPLAIARVESGRLDPATGRARPWPWTINTGGVGSFFATKEEAVAAVEALRARGVQSIDIGCMQVNLRHHPQAFASLDEAFDPHINARYAVRFLTALYRQTGNWVQATAYYHSQTQDLGQEYARKVLGPEAVPPGSVPGQLARAPSGPYASWPPPGMAYAAFPPSNYAFGAFGPQAGAKLPLAVPGLNVPNKGVPGLGGGASFLALSGQPLPAAGQTQASRMRR